MMRQIYYDGNCLSDPRRFNHIKTCHPRIGIEAVHKILPRGRGFGFGLRSELLKDKENIFALAMSGSLTMIVKLV